MMILGYGKQLRARVFAGVLGILAAFGLALPLYAQSALSVTVTPPLFQLTIGPGEAWASTVKIVNNNSYDVSYYATVMDFAAQGEDGQAKYVPLVEETGDPTRANFSLASWIIINPGPYTIQAGQSMEVPFSVVVPANAEPGGHYASILIGTQPSTQTGSGATMKVSSYVSSLLFVKIKGDIVEKGRIREFISERTIYQNPSADFLLRFENTGNTHLKPQGNVTLYNMWGKERGMIDINQKGNFGNVLPKSIRRFQFSWSGEESVFDVGRYSAVVTLAFGQDSKQNVSAVTYFWVVPTVPMAITFGILALFVLLISWLIRRYIRRALELETIRAGLHTPSASAGEVKQVSEMYAPVPAVSQYSIETLIEPIKEGVIDLRKLAGSQIPEAPVVHPENAGDAPPSDSTMSLTQFVQKYRLFFVFIIVVGIAGVSALWYFSRALVPTRGYQITDVQVHEEPVTEVQSQ